MVGTMTRGGSEDVGEAIEQLKQLGLKEYEAKCFVALSRVDSATAKGISDQSDVPRTRVYDATRVLEAKGLIEVQHSSPQQFRAVSIDEAVETLRAQFETQFRDLRANLERLEQPEQEEEEEPHEVWSMSGTDAVAHRTQRLIDAARSEIVLVVGVESLLTGGLFASLNQALDRGVTVIVGAVSEDIEDEVQQSLDGGETFVSGLEWLQGSGSDADETAIGRLLLADQSNILVSSFDPSTNKEQAVFGRGFTNGLVVITRRLMATGRLAPEGLFDAP